MQLDLDCLLQQCDAPKLDAFIAQNGDAAATERDAVLNLSKGGCEDSSAEESDCGLAA